MPLLLSPVLLSELDAVHRLRLSINADQPIERFLFPNGASDISVATSAAQDRQGMADPKCAFRQVVVKDSESGDIVSYALWYFFTGTEEKDGEEGVVGAGWLDGGWPSDANEEALDALVEEGTKKRKALMGTRPHACMYEPNDISILIPFLHLLWLLFLESSSSSSLSINNPIDHL